MDFPPTRKYKCIRRGTPEVGLIANVSARGPRPLPQHIILRANVARKLAQGKQLCTYEGGPPRLHGAMRSNGSTTVRRGRPQQSGAQKNNAGGEGGGAERLSSPNVRPYGR